MGNLIAVLGPTNTGKTHYALERMMAHATGMIGLPLRLLAREVYDKVVAQKGAGSVALVTGEERIWPQHARYFICTVEAMPLSQPVEFMAVDEIQLAADPDRGHVFTNRILEARGRSETLLLGSATMRDTLRALGLEVETTYRERFSQLTYAGPMKITKLPKRSAVVAFSAEEVYAIAELLKRQRGGCAVVMGALSPRTRNAQVDLYQSGEVDYLVATDAIGMGLNLNVDHIAFASRTKFDGRRRRGLSAAETGQIAGRAGRFRTDGTFGETGECTPFDEELVGRLETHNFEPVERLWWRNARLDYASLDALLKSLSRPSPHRVLRQTGDALDELTLRRMAEDSDVRDHATTPARIRRLWDLCTLPDFQKSGPDGHHRIVQSLYEVLAEPDARLGHDWMERQVSRLGSTEGDLDVLQQRLAAIRTWTYAANRSDWVGAPDVWRSRTREIEDSLSDALHERLTLRFVDKRTTALMRGLDRNDGMEAGVAEGGEVTVEGHVVGHLEGLVFKPDVTDKSVEGRAVRNAALQALGPVLSARLGEIQAAERTAFTLDDERRIVFEGAPVARLVAGNHWMRPGATLIGGEDGAADALEATRLRLSIWIVEHVKRNLAALTALETQLNTAELTAPARGLAWRVLEAGGSIDLRGDDVPVRLSNEEREALKGWGIRVGRVAAYAPEALKPAKQALLATLFSVAGDTDIPVAAAGAGSFDLASGDGWTDAALAINGYLRFGPRAIRADLAERLGWEIAKRRKEAGKNVFELPPELASIVSSSGEVFPDIVRGYGLAPAEKDPETGLAKTWRFTARANPDGRPPRRENRSGDMPRREGSAQGRQRNNDRQGEGRKPRPEGDQRRGKPSQRRDARPERKVNPDDSPFGALAALLPPESSRQPQRKKKPRNRKRGQGGDAGKVQASANRSGGAKDVAKAMFGAITTDMSRRSDDAGARTRA